MFDQAGSEKVHALVEKAKKNNVKLVFPVDFITADKFDKDAKVYGSWRSVWVHVLTCRQTGHATLEQGIPEGWMGLDAGPNSRDLYHATVLEARTILWNGYVLSMLGSNLA